MSFITNFITINTSLGLLVSLFFIWWLEPHSAGQVGFIILVVTSVIVVLSLVVCVLKRLFSKNDGLKETDSS